MRSFGSSSGWLLSAIILMIGIWGGIPLYAAWPEPSGADQSKVITGRVVDANGEPVIGAAVMVEGTTDGILVDNDGNFGLSAEEGQTLIVSMIGYVEKRVRVTAKDEYLVIMEEETTQIEDAMVVAFSTQKKESVVSSIATIRPAELKTPSSNLTTVLGGRIAGVITQQLSGEPGQDNAEFFIRGVTTFNSNARGPLILIDNVELSANDLARLQPDDIASFSVLKDATATALYGSRGANGVMLVETKRGHKGEMQVGLRAQVGFQNARRLPKYMDAADHATFYNEAYQNDGLGTYYYTPREIEM